MTWSLAVALRVLALVDKITFRVVATPMQALQKLHRAKIPVIRLHAEGRYTVFSVPDNYRKKVFAIFAHSCYNISIIKDSIMGKVRFFAQMRFGCLIGVALFLGVILLADSFILRVEVNGSGAYLQDKIITLLAQNGVKQYGVYRGVPPLLNAKLLNLPSVQFCTVQKKGSVLVVQVEVCPQPPTTATELYCDRSGQISQMLVLQGDCSLTVGDSVQKGQLLLAPTSPTEVCVGYFVIDYQGEFAIKQDGISDQNAQTSLSVIPLYAGEDTVVSRSYTATTTPEGAIYTIRYQARHTLAIHID